jgi:glycine/D-amino acid oxidase-like deaminating enzyme
VSSPHAVVVGAGIVGASISFHLARRGVRVTLVDAGAPASGATGVSFAWINARDKNPRHYHDLNRRSLDMWPRFARELGGDIGLTWGGEMRWVATRKAAASFAARVKELQSWGYPIRLLWAEQARALEPGLEFGPVSVASFSEIDGHVDAVAATRAAIERAQQAGLELRAEAPVRSIAVASERRRGRKRARGIVLESGATIEADFTVVAAGTGAERLAASAGVVLREAPTHGATIVTTPVGHIFQTVCVIHTARDSAGLLMNMRQLVDGSVMVHGGSHDGSVGDRSRGEADALLHAAAAIVPELRKAGVREVRSGRRPMPADGHPVLGFSEEVENLYFAVTHSGVTLAPVIGEFAAIEILDGARIDLLAPYRVERFADTQARPRSP